MNRFIFISVLIMLLSCTRNNDAETENTAPISDIISTSFAEKDLLRLNDHKTYAWFDLQALEGKGEPIDTPFVYVRERPDTIVVRVSNDVNNPYIITRQNGYWHCKWSGDGRGDSVMVDRFINEHYICEYIQRLQNDTTVVREVRVTDLTAPQLTLSPIYDEWIRILRPSKKLNKDVASIFHELWDESSTIKPSGKLTIATNMRDDLTAPNYKIFRTIGNSTDELHYSPAPLGLYDEHKDISRPRLLRHIP